MATEAKPKLITAEEFMQMDLGEGMHELVRGEIIEVTPPGGWHGFVCGNAALLLGNFGKQTGHGYIMTNDTAVLTERDPDSVRGGDVLYYSNARWARGQAGPGIPPIVPDLVVEVYSPSDRPGKMGEKISEYLNAGIAMVWVLYPERRTLRIERLEDPVPMILEDGQAVEGLPELPGFRCLVSEFFD
jgi:Uma2 family endonuclease